MFWDMPLDQLEKYKPARVEPKDFERFWRETLNAVGRFPLQAKFEPVDLGLELVDTFDVTFAGYAGHPIKAWLMLPRNAAGRLPCVVTYLGYGGGRSLPIDHLVWCSAGYAELVMDTRGQGSGWSPGDTGDPEPDGSNSHFPGFMTRGILSPGTYYYRRVFTDAVRAVEAARSHERVDGKRIAVMGGSQGGGIALAVAGLVPDLSAVLPDVPFLCNIRAAVEITDAFPYQEIVKYCQVHRDLVERVFETLEYFDMMHFATRAHCPALFSTALQDEICPPRTVFAAYNHYAGEKSIRVWRFNHHEGGQSFQAIEQLKFLKRLWK